MSKSETMKPAGEKAPDRMPQYEADEAPVAVEEVEGLVRRTDPAAPEDLDSDPAAGAGKIDFKPDAAVAANGGDAPSHGSR